MKEVVLVALIAAVPATVGALVGIKNKFGIAEVHTLVNGNLEGVKRHLAEVTEKLRLLAESSNVALGENNERLRRKAARKPRKKA